MKFTKNVFFTISIFLSFGIVYAQNAQLVNGKVLTEKQLIEDYNILYASLINYHPAPFQYTAESELKAFYEKEKALFSKGLTELEFNLVARNLVARIKCGHTYARPSADWYKSIKGQSVLLPFDVKKIRDKVYIRNTVDEDFDFKINDELISLNNIPIEDILQQMALNHQRDGNTHSFVHEAVINSFRTYYLFLYGSQNEILVEYKTKSSEVKQANVKTTNKKIKEIEKAALPGNFKVLFENKWSLFAADTTAQLAYLKINSFGNRNEYKEYYKKIFQSLKQMPGSRLILDIRDNGGGYFGNGNKLLTYLTPNEFEFNMRKSNRKINKNKHAKLDKWSQLTKFAFSIKPSKHRVKGQKTVTFTYKPDKLAYKGKVNVIANGITFSQAALVAAHLKEYGATFYGAETGGTENGTNCMLNYQLILPNSALSIIIPHYQVISNSTKGEFGYGVKPNIELVPTLNPGEDQILLDVMNVLIENK